LRSGSFGVAPTPAARARARALAPLPTIDDPHAAEPPPPDPAELKNELQLGHSQACGRASWIDVGDVAMRDNKLIVELVIKKVHLVPGNADERPGGDFCSKSTVESEERIPVAYAFRGDRVLRLTPIPKRVTDIAIKFDYY
jgi:hypothetical protein